MGDRDQGQLENKQSYLCAHLSLTAAFPLHYLRHTHIHTHSQTQAHKHRDEFQGGFKELTLQEGRELRTFVSNLLRLYSGHKKGLQLLRLPHLFLSSLHILYLLSYFGDFGYKLLELLV